MIAASRSFRRAGANIHGNIEMLCLGRVLSLQIELVLIVSRTHRSPNDF